MSFVIQGQYNNRLRQGREKWNKARFPGWAEIFSRKKELLHFDTIKQKSNYNETTPKLTH